MTPDNIASMCRVPYQEAIGSLMYASMGTCPDISFAISTLSQFLNNPGHTHWEAVKHVFWYLLSTKGLQLTFGGGKHGLEGYTDTDSASQEHRHAISGYAFIIDGGAVSWSSCKQELVTLSTAEAEYIATTHAAKEAIWLCNFIGEVFSSWPSSPPLSLSLNGNITNYVYHVWICFLTTMKIKCQDCSMVNCHSLSLHNTVYG